ncbi:MAG: twin-arginine translocase TatA/TatE family subunit [Alphaproteobacteria bacterium]|nr:twin-arginine translocase TatA/TatE family subunit [Alphaproteobacteria bacterium]
MSIGFVQIFLVLVVVLVLFGAGKLPGVMGDFGKGLRNFKDGFKEGEEDKNEEPPKPALPDKSKAE